MKIKEQKHNILLSFQTTTEWSMMNWNILNKMKQKAAEIHQNLLNNRTPFLSAVFEQV